MFVAVGCGTGFLLATSRDVICSNVTFTGAAPVPNAAACLADDAAGGAGDEGGCGGTAPGAGAPADC